MNYYLREAARLGFNGRKVRDIVAEAVEVPTARRLHFAGTVLAAAANLRHTLEDEAYAEAQCLLAILQVERAQCFQLDIKEGQA